MSLMKFINLNSQADSNESMTLQNFVEVQHNERQHVKQKIGEYSEYSRKIVREGFDACMKKLRGDFKTDSNKGPGAGNKTNPKGMQKGHRRGLRRAGLRKGDELRPEIQSEKRLHDFLEVCISA